ENAKLRAQLFDKVSDQKDTACGTSANTKFAKQSILGKPPKVGETHALSKPVTANSIPTPQGSKVMKNVKVIAQECLGLILLSLLGKKSMCLTKLEQALGQIRSLFHKGDCPGMFRINPFKPSREEKHVPNKVRASVRTNP
nr:hypothetical protein [Tanacetum cinerariifolium]